MGVAVCVGDHFEGGKPGSVTRGPETESKVMAERGSCQAVEWPFFGHDHSSSAGAGCFANCLYTFKW